MDLLTKEKLLRKKLRELEKKATCLYRVRMKLKDQIEKIEKKRLRQEQKTFKKVKRLPRSDKNRLEQEFLRALGLDEEVQDGI